jgi:phosphoribosylformylglycinamidine (FGAM) synthase-like enzyme
LHDISDGGLFTAAAELSFTNKIGVEIFVPENFHNDREMQYLFAEKQAPLSNFIMNSKNKH